MPFGSPIKKVIRGIEETVGYVGLFESKADGSYSCGVLSNDPAYLNYDLDRQCRAATPR